MNTLQEVKVLKTRKDDFEIYFEKDLIMDNVKVKDDSEIVEQVERYLQFTEILSVKGIEEFSIEKEKINFNTYYKFKCYGEEVGGIEITHVVSPLSQGVKRNILDFISLEEIEKEYE